MFYNHFTLDLHEKKNFLKRTIILVFQIIISSCHTQSTESISSSSPSAAAFTSQSSTVKSVIGNNTSTSTSSSSSISSSTSRHKYIPTSNPKVKKRGSSHTPSSDASKAKKNTHPGSVQNINNTREALAQEGSDQQVSMIYTHICLAVTVKIVI